ncbi:MAG: hypothetical protein HY703_08180 [Gemmatimonadetes bacterium]|nr:hypothetical protein [Gemmatimonadota bacterium]
MISSEDIQRLIRRDANEEPVLSVFLDMQVNSENKRTYSVFLHQERARHAGSGSRREEMSAAFGRIEGWLADEFQATNKGVAVYTQVGGEWLEGLQFPVPVQNRTVLADRPVITPLAQILESYHHYGVILVDREHLRMTSVYLGEPVHEHEVRTSPYPTPHDVQRGGYSAIDFQKRKAEEVRHFFKEFALEVSEFDCRYAPDTLVLSGTDENVKNFLEFLPAPVREKVGHTAHAPVDASAAEVLERLAPYFGEQLERDEALAIDLLRDRVRNRHLAVAGFQDTLEQLQEAKVDTLVIARDIERLGARCCRCGFYLDRQASACPYCGGETAQGVDLVEAMVRIAEEQDVPLRFVSPATVADLHGVGGLLKF